MRYECAVEMSTLSIGTVNSMRRSEFVETFGGVFEASAWVAEEAWERRPFRDRDVLRYRMIEVVRKAGIERQTRLITPHPDLGSPPDRLSRASASQQASEGLDRLGEPDRAQFRENNAVFRERFGFPFVICVRLNDVNAILKAFERRLSNDHETEGAAAIDEIYEIAELRFAALIVES
jgi:2-oxo-4-hydroxy-4-carboxy-5-ureidoimidazoline decarboxylase